MLLEMILNGLSWGVFGVSVLIPLCAFSVAWYYLEPIVKRQKAEELELLDKLFEEDFEDEPELPVNEEPRQRYRFVASTIVRPPNVVQREDIEDDD